MQKKEAWQLDAATPTEHHHCECSRGREFLIRMNTGADPVLAIEQFAKDHGIRYGKVHATFMGAFNPCKYLKWTPDTANPDNWHNETIATNENLTMLCSIGGIISQRPTEAGGEETFLAAHFVSGGCWDAGMISGHLEVGTKVVGCMQCFITELTDLEVLKPVDEYGIAYTRPENWHRSLK